MEKLEVGYMGPPGTYSHLVAEQYFGKRHTLVPFPTILEVCAFVSHKPARRGIIPIENSSGGAIYETVDILLANRPKLDILEEVSLQVRLALLGRQGQPPTVLYSHFAPLEHCAPWIRRHLPRVRREVVSSTAVAAMQAAWTPRAAALGNRRLSELYGLDVLHFPVEADVPNITSFLAITGGPCAPRHPNKTTLAVRLPNVPGSLCTFLDQFRQAHANLTSILSRPIRGCHREYAFLVDIEGGEEELHVRQALAAARKTCMRLRVVGSYPSGTMYKS